MTQDNTTQDTSKPEPIRERLETILSDLEEIETELEVKGHSIMDIDMSIRSLYIMLEDEDVEW